PAARAAARRDDDGPVRHRDRAARAGAAPPRLVQLHHLSFIAWLVVAGVHVLAYARRVPRLLVDEWRRRIPGAVGRYLLLATALAAGVALALETSPLDDRWLV